MPHAVPDILTVAELAEYLKVPKSTIYKMAQDHQIPAQKVGRHWRFHRAAIEKWLHRGRSAHLLEGGNG